MPKKVLQINVSDSGSTGSVVEELGMVWTAQGFENYVAYGRSKSTKKSKLIRIGNKWDMGFHYMKTRIFDLHGFGSFESTNKLVKHIKAIKPDVILLHNLHGYYINIEVLFNFIRTLDIPIIWTLYDCWAFTGHCTYFDSVQCENWKTVCQKCPLKAAYPASWLVDNSKHNFLKKEEIFKSIKNLVLIAHSEWLLRLVRESFLKDYRVVKINNGVNTAIFKPTYLDPALKKYNIYGFKYVLGVANIWNKRKGLDDFLKLSLIIDPEIKIVLVGLKKENIKKLPLNIIGIPHTDNKQELAVLYSCADVFINPTSEDNFPSTNIEALACGTAVITYNTGGSPEAIDAHTGFVVPQGDINGLLNSINEIRKNGKEHYNKLCRERAIKYFNCEDRYSDYKLLYDEMVENNKALIRNND
jgi:putative colanic acid biosynthesis glycosyltransferase